MEESPTKTIVHNILWMVKTPNNKPADKKGPLHCMSNFICVYYDDTLTQGSTTQMSQRIYETYPRAKVEKF